MTRKSQDTPTPAPETLDREAQRRREAGADGAMRDKLPMPGPSIHAGRSAAGPKAG